MKTRENGKAEKGSKQDAMKDIERTLGILEEQGRWQAKKIESIELSSREMNHKIDSLLAFKWKIMGASIFITFVTSILIEVARARG